jgi:hypothetical protein
MGKGSVTLRARNRCKRAGRTRSWIVCAVLAASLWRAPVPWIHSHETLEAQGLPEAALSRHVHQLHPQESEHSILGWHVHLSYPWEVSNEPAPPCEPNSPKPQTVYDMPYVASPASATVDLDRYVSLDPANLPSAMHSVFASRQQDVSGILDRHFLQIHLPSVSLRALNCVAQC